MDLSQIWSWWGRTQIFNTETPEQLSWRNRFEPQLHQISVVNYDFLVHSLMISYRSVESRVGHKGSGLSDVFWAKA